MVILRASNIVKPAAPTPTGLMYLSEFDQVIAKTHIPIVYFYRPNSDDLLLNPTEILKNSLSKALTIFYPLAGRLQWTKRGRLELNCTSMGILFLETESEATINDFRDFTPTSETKALVPSVDYDKPINEMPLLLVQVTMFSCGGISLGLGMSHVIMDGRCIVLFVSVWARIARGEKPENLPFLDRTILDLKEEEDLTPLRFDHSEFGTRPILNGRLNHLEEQKKESIVVMLKLSKEQIQMLKNEANEFRSVDNSSKPFSRYEVVTAHTWRCASKARLHKSEQLTSVRIAVDFSHRMVPPLPNGYFGNAILPVTPIATTGELLSKPLGYGCSKIREAIETVTDKYVRSLLVYLKREEDLSKFRYSHNVGSTQGAFLGNPNLAITSWIQLPLFGVDFGWGKEIYMGPGAIGYDGKSFILPSRDEDGSFDVPFRLQVEHMDAFQKFFYEHIYSSISDSSPLLLSCSISSLLSPSTPNYRTSPNLASIASFSPSPRAQFHSSWKKTTKTLKNLSPLITPNKIVKPNHNLLLSSSSSSSSSSSYLFPCNLKLPSLTASVPTHLHPLSDSTDESFVRNLEGLEFSDLITNGLPNLQTISTVFDQIPNGLANLQTIPNGSREIPNGESVRTRRIFIEDPRWITYSLMKDLDKKAKKVAKSEAQEVGRKKYNLLLRRQIKAETEAWQKMVEEYREIEREMCENKLGHHLPFVKKLFLGWFEPFRAAITKEQRVLQSKIRKTALTPFMDLLTADKMAVIAMHKMMAAVMGAHGREDRAVPVAYAALQIGAAIEQEVRIHGFLEKTNMSQSQKTVAPTEEGFCKDGDILRKRLKSLIKKKKTREVQKLVEDEEIKPWGRDIQAKLGSRLIQLLIETAYVQAPLDQSADSPPDIRPAFSHTFIRLSPRKKNSQRSGVILPDPLVLAGLHGTAKHTVIPYMPMLVPPKKWKRYDRGGYFFLPSYLMRTHGSRPQQDAVKNTAGEQMQKMYEALDTLGNTKWRVNKRVLSVMESIWAGGGNTGGLVDRKDVPIPERPESEDDTEIKKWKWSVRGAKKVNRELHSQRCDTELKLSVARQMEGEDGFYYPHNMDFRGRAYPMHSHLNHLNSDICRGVLEFAEGRPLGKSGLRWLKIHLANLYGDGVEKLSYEGRLAFVENHLENVRDSADNPLHGTQWWLTAEDPFQCLAACINLSEALTSSAPHNVISHLPIHQDGSCNGLQHYAALGRDYFGAVAVNLVAGEKPADLYSEIAARVHDIIQRDSNKEPATNPNAILAKALIGQVDRKLVKQTVMTSVYGVTFVGARQQIKRRLQEKGQITDDILLFKASCYAAKVTMAALEELFDAARGIMGWLGDCAKVIASQNQPVRWTTPLGLPILQPYFKPKKRSIKTSLQILSLKQDGTTVEIQKQRTAFPPNFVHSLDGSHMMMTAVACRDAGLRFAGVHDSFWTHACNVDRMNRILREKFVELYSIPILENLLESFQKAYPELTFPPLPERGDFDLQEVIDSPYFFN